jgi:hypothetical protein
MMNTCKAPATKPSILPDLLGHSAGEYHHGIANVVIDVG